MRTIGKCSCIALLYAILGVNCRIGCSGNIPDGVYVDCPDGSTRFRLVKPPSTEELTQLVHTIAQRVGRFLERQGLLEQDADNSYLTGGTVDEDPMSKLLGSSITHRIAVGAQAGCKCSPKAPTVGSLKTLPASDPEDQFGDTVGKVAGFSLHAGVAPKAHERQKLERLCRFISRPAICEKRLSLTEYKDSYLIKRKTKRI